MNPSQTMLGVWRAFAAPIIIIDVVNIIIVVVVVVVVVVVIIIVVVLGYACSSAGGCSWIPLRLGALAGTHAGHTPLRHGLVDGAGPVSIHGHVVEQATHGHQRQHALTLVCAVAAERQCHCSMAALPGAHQRGARHVLPVHNAAHDERVPGMHCVQHIGRVGGEVDDPARSYTRRNVVAAVHVPCREACINRAQPRAMRC